MISDPGRDADGEHSEDGRMPGEKGFHESVESRECGMHLINTERLLLRP